MSGLPRQAAPAPTLRSAFLLGADDKAGADALSLLLVKAVISAAEADGQIDTRESQEILNKINGLDLPAADKAANQVVIRELTRADQ